MAQLSKPLSLSVLLLMCWPLQVSALSTDKDQPLEIEADSAELDQSGNAVTTYVGNVIVIQGTMKMTGDRLTVHYDENSELKDAFLEGKPAYFKQRPDGKDEDFEGWGLRMEYHAQQNLLELISQAKLKQGKQIMTGAHITYDTERSILRGTGGTTTKTEDGKKTTTGGGRVKITIPPKAKDKQ